MDRPMTGVSAPLRRNAAADDVLPAAYRYARRLPDVLEGLVQALAERLRLLDASLWLQGVGELVLDRQGAGLRCSWRGETHGRSTASGGEQASGVHSIDEAVLAADMAAASMREADRRRRERSSVESSRYPIAYAAGVIGELRLRWPRKPEAQELEHCREFARQCGRLAKRYEVQRWTEQRLGRPLLLVGASRPLRELELFMERASRSGLPVLLSGEFGTEKALVAASIHCCGPRSDGPFVEVNCAEPAGTPAQWFEQARGGTLYFSGIDELALPLQSQIPQHMHSHLGQWLTAADAADVRIVATTVHDLAERVREERFSKPLLAELDFLSITLPPLRERIADIEPLVASILDRHGHRAETKCTGALIALCKAHAWPENLFELERAIARLAVMTDAQPIAQADIQRYAPWIIAAPAEDLADADTAERYDDRADDALLPASDRWLRCVIARDLAELKPLHEALKKALLYLGEHYAEPISLGQLAQQAHISPSHLTFLFRSEIGSAFKPFLLGIRIYKAKEILTSDTRMRITEVAMSVGFTDLSHFEKSFRRVVGQSPREFRQGVRT